VNRYLRSARYVKQTGKGHFALLVTAVEPGSEFRVSSSISHDSVPPEFQQAALDVLSDAEGCGSCLVQLVDGAYHPVDSTANDFERVAHMLVEQLRELPVGSGAGLREGELRRYWLSRWARLRMTLISRLQSRLPEGFQLEGDEWARVVGPFKQSLRVWQNGPLLPSHFDLLVCLEERESGLLLAETRYSSEPWAVEIEGCVESLFAAWDVARLERLADPAYLLDEKVPGVRLWVPEVKETLERGAGGG